MTLAMRTVFWLSCLVLYPQAAAHAQDKAVLVPICKPILADPGCGGFLAATSGFKAHSGNLVVAQQSPGAARDNARFIIFLHTGAGPRGPAEKLAKDLQAKSFKVGGTDVKVDSFGVGVDYFREQDKIGAANVADIANMALPPGLKRLQPRPQKVSNPPGFLGVWLYEKVTAIDSAKWSSEMPKAGWCYHESLNKPGAENFTVHCHLALERCETARSSSNQPRKTPCTFTVLSGASWTPRRAGQGATDPWVQQSDKPLGPPFPQF